MLNMEGVDYSYSRPDPTSLAHAGKRFAIRYVGTPSSDKNLTHTEANRLKAVGIELVAVYESTAGFMLSANGATAAERAFTNAWNLGMPHNRPVYFALDIDPNRLTTDQWRRCAIFLANAREWVGGPYIGVYGGYDAIETLVGPIVDDRPANWGWQTYAWSAGQWSTKAQLQQYRNGVNLAGGTVDLCRYVAPDYGQWGYNQQEDIMTPNQMTELKAHIDERLVRVASWLTTGRINALVDPGKPAWAFADDPGTITLNEVKPPAIDFDAFADAVASKMPTGSADIALVKAAMREVLAEARFDIIGQIGTALEDEL